MSVSASSFEALAGEIFIRFHFENLGEYIGTAVPRWCGKSSTTIRDLGRKDHKVCLNAKPGRDGRFVAVPSYPRDMPPANAAPRIRVPG
jgi:hypothetical protein